MKRKSSYLLKIFSINLFLFLFMGSLGGTVNGKDPCLMRCKDTYVSGNFFFFK